METSEAAKSLEAISNETRLRIFRYLVKSGENGVAVGEIQKKLKIPGSTLSHHISKLTRADMVIQERQSTTLLCRANFDSMNSLISFLTDRCCEGHSN